MKVGSRFFTTFALLCAFVCFVSAQTTTLDYYMIQQRDKLVKMADKHPKDGKKQLNVAKAILNDQISSTLDYDLALSYAYKALKIAKNSPLKDTLLALTYETIGSIYMEKNEADSMLYYYERALDAYTLELGRFDPLTNGTKLSLGWILWRAKPSLGFPKIFEAFYDNKRTPIDKCIYNMGDATIIMEIALELFIAEQIDIFRYALIMVNYEGKKCLLLQTDKWNMERTLLGWSMAAEDQMDDSERPTILFTEDEQFIVLTGEEKKKFDVRCNFKYLKVYPTHLNITENAASLFFLSHEYYEKVLNMFRKFTANNKD